MKPLVLRGVAAQKLSNLESAYRRIKHIEPNSEAETIVRAGLLALIKTKRKQLRREAVIKRITRRTNNAEHFGSRRTPRFSS